MEWNLSFQLLIRVFFCCMFCSSTPPITPPEFLVTRLRPLPFTSSKGCWYVVSVHPLSNCSVQIFKSDSTGLNNTG